MDGHDVSIDLDLAEVSERICVIMKDREETDRVTQRDRD